MITYQSINISYRLKNRRKLSQWIRQCAEETKMRIGELAIVLCDDVTLLEYNVKYLKHNTLTDIITFNYNEGSVLSGDIIISLDRIRENAYRYDVPMDLELKRVIIHGVLHLLGFRDKIKEEKDLMRRMEDEYLQKYDLLFRG